MKNIFVSGATGFQGGAIANVFIENGYQVKTLKRSLDKFNARKGLEVVEGGFEDKVALGLALRGVETAVFTLPLIFDLEASIKMVQNFIEIVKEEGVKRVVFNTSFDLPNEKTGLLALDIKVAIKELFDQSGLDVITLVPDVYIDNLLAPWSVPLLLDQGIMPYPIPNGQKIPWISHRELAVNVFHAVKNTQLVGQVLPVGGGLYSGEEIAKVLGDVLNKPIQFISLTPDEFEQNLAPAFGDLAAQEISNLYRYLNHNIHKINNKSFKETQSILGLEPTPLSLWAKQVEQFIKA